MINFNTQAMLRKRKTATLALLFLFNAPASAEPSPDEVYNLTLEELMGVRVISLSTGREESIRQAPSIASVITAQDIKNMGARNLTEVLATVPGLHASRTSQIMGPKYIIRGVNTRFNPQVLMMVDNVPITSVLRGDRHVIWGEFPIAAIDKIEIIRGPGSALHGADAFSGIIHIITKSYDQIEHSTIGARLGSFDTSEIWASARWRSGNLKLAMSAEFLETDGHNQIVEIDAQTLMDDLGLAPSVSNAPGPVSLSSRGIDLRLSADYRSLDLKIGFQNRDNVGLGTGGSNALDPDGKSGSEKLLAVLRYSHDFNSIWHWEGHLSHYRSTQNIEENVYLLPRGTFFGSFPDGLIGNPGWREHNQIIQNKFEYAPDDELTATVGFGWRNEDLYHVTETRNFTPSLEPLPELIDVSDTEFIFIDEQKRTSKFAFVQGQYQFNDNWEGTFGVRWDDYSDFGSTTNPRLALVWNRNNQVSSKLLYGRAFRSPSFLDLKDAFDPVSRGNSALKPETVDTIEWAINLNTSQNLFFDIGIYYFDAQNLIDYVPDEGSTTSTAQNFTNLKGYGSELEVNYQISKTIRLNGNYAWQKVKDLRTNSDFGNTPNHQAYLRMQWQLADNIQLTGQVRHVGRQLRNPADLRPPLQGYSDASLLLNMTDIFNDFDLQFKINNLFDNEVFEPSVPPSSVRPQVDIPNDIPQSGRAIYLSISRSW